MKKFYAIASLFLALFMISANGQFIEIDGKAPVFHLKFDSLTTDDTRLHNVGTEYAQYTSNSGEVTDDTIEGHSWGGGLFSGFTFQEQTVKENTLPTMFWNSYLDYPNRPQGIAAYSRSTGGYMGPRGSSARTISFFMHATDSARADTANGAWDINYLYGCGVPGVAGERLYWYYHPDVNKFNIWFGGDANSATSEGAISNNIWVHLALVIPEGGARADIKLYIDGVETFFDEENGDLSLVLNTTPEADWDGVRVGALSNMWMADYRIYDQALTGSEIGKLAANSSVGMKTSISTEFKIYPVPNKGIFTVECEGSDMKQLVIQNLIGQKVYESLMVESKTFDVSDLESGIYFVSVRDSRNVLSTQKMIIE